MNISPHQLSQSKGSSEGLQPASGQIVRPILTRPVSVSSSSVTTSANANGRVLPVVYLKMQQREQMVPVASRPGNLISTVGPKISTAPSVNISSLTGNQPGYVTIQGPIRSVTQSSASQTHQPHIITLPKVANSLALSNQQVITLQSVAGSSQGGPLQQQQYVTIQAPIVSKTQQNSGGLTSVQTQPQYVAIRTPVLNQSGTGANPSPQSQYVTIQAPVVQGTGQSNPSQSATYLPVTSVSQAPMKSPITYQVLKSNVKGGDQHVVYPVSVSNIMPSAQPKMVFSHNVTMMPKMSVVPSGSTAVTVQAGPDLVATTGGISSYKLATTPQFSTKLLNSPSLNLLQGKSVQTLSLRKEGVVLPPADSNPVAISQSKVLMPMGVSVSNASSTNSTTQGFINLTIANGHIQPSSSKPKPEGQQREKFVKDSCDLSGFIIDRSRHHAGQLPVSTCNNSLTDVSNAEKVSESVEIQDASSKQKMDNINEIIDIKTLLMSGSSCRTDGLSLQSNKNADDPQNEAQDHMSQENLCELNKADEPFLTDEPQSPSSPINLFCEEGDLAHSPPNDLPPPKYTITMPENPDEDIKIQLVMNDGRNSDRDASSQIHDSPSTNPNKPLLKKSSPKLLSKANSSSKGQSLLRNPAALAVTSSPKLSKPSSKVGVKSILKPQGAKKTEIKTEMPDAIEFMDESMSSPGDTKDSLDAPISPLTTSSFEDFDAVAALEWKDGVGLLPGSNLKFRLNEFGLMEMVSDDDNRSIKKDTNSDSEGLMIDEGSNSSLEGKLNLETKENKKDAASDDVFCCETCNVYGLASEFLSDRFCTQACSAAFTVKKAWQYRREQDLRALRLRRKKRRLEQQKLARDKAEQEMGDADKKRASSQTSSKTAKKLKSSAPESMSDGEDSLEDPNQNCSQEPVSPSLSFCSSDKAGASYNSDSFHDDASKKFLKHKPTPNFVWSKYLDMVKAKAAPSKLFKNSFPYIKNGFKVGMKLEGIDPEHPACFCVLTVAEVKGYRLRLHFDGYPENYDYWVNADSPEIFQAGWCEKNMRQLTPPKGHTNFNWSSYLKTCKAVAAPRMLFTNKSSTSTVCPNGFRVGMKLEAVDKKNSSLVCVASISDIVDGRCLIHFDSWDDVYDYWADPSSPYIHPLGWCEQNGVTLTPPNQYKDPSMFTWSKYLKETKTQPAPSRAFKQRQPNGFRRGMRLEAVDKRVPHLLRVATVDDVHDHTIRIRFDGWPDEYSYWVDDDSPDIHPAGWCLETKHPLEPPLSEIDMKATARCGIPGCRGEGHVKGPKYTCHITAQNCPYAPENLHTDSHLPDRMTSSNDNVSLEESTPVSRSNKMERKPYSRPPKWKRLLQDAEEREHKRPRLCDDEFGDRSTPLGTMKQKLQSELERSVVDPGYYLETGPGRPALWAKHSQPLHDSPMIRDAVNPQAWTIEDVLEFLSSIPCLEEYGKIFKEQDIDGEALLMLTQNDLVSSMKLKLGHAIRLYNCIVILRQKCM